MPKPYPFWASDSPLWLFTNNAGVGFYFQEFDGECHSVADCFDDCLSKVVVDVVDV